MNVMNLHDILDLIRGLVRPFITISGWMAILILVVILGLKFADKEMALVVIGLVTGSMATMIGFYFRDRSIQKGD